MTALLEASDLTFRYGDRLTVDRVSFTIERGEILGLLGPNGAGKTTTISCLVGLLRPSSGHLRFEGVPFDPTRDVSQRSRIGLVPQDLALYGALTARENLRFFAEMFGVSKSDLDAACARGLAIAGLEDRANDRVDTFSGGMKRRLNLAVGELHSPALLILDEPTVGVDPQSRNHVFEALEKLRAAGRTLLYTTHYMEEAKRLCDRIAILDGGKLLALGTASELATHAGIPGADLEQVFLKLTGRTLRDD